MIRHKGGRVGVAALPLFSIIEFAGPKAEPGGIDNALDNGKAKEERPTGRIYVKEKPAEERAPIENGDSPAKEIYDKGAEKRAQQGIWHDKRTMGFVC